MVDGVNGKLTVYGGAGQGNSINIAGVPGLLPAQSSTVWKGAAGAVAEFMVVDNWSIKGEYLYTQLGGISTPVNCFSTIDPVEIFYTSYIGFNMVPSAIITSMLA